MDKIEVSKKIGAILNTFCKQECIFEDSAEISSMDLNSLEFIQVIVSIEETFDFHFDDDDLIFENYKTLGNMVDYVLKKIS